LQVSEGVDHDELGTMKGLTDSRFSFISDGLSPDTFGVVSFQGEEGLSRTYQFEAMLVSDNLEIDLAEVLQNPARFIIHRGDENDVAYHGILRHFEQLQEADGLCFYRACLVPRLWWLSLTHHNQIFLDKSVPEIVELVLKDGGLTSVDYDFRLRGSYGFLDYVCQYGESHLDFISRWCEREGIYYYFDQSGDAEKVVFTDTAIAHTQMPQGSELHYSPPSGLDALHMGEVVSFFNCRRSLTPGSIFLKDYNYMKPSLEVSGSASVSAGGRGQFYYYGGHIETPEEGTRLAQIRAESILCRREEFRGESSVPYMEPGFTFDLKDHYRGEFNQRYLATDIRHEGSQAGYLMAGLQSQLSEAERRVYYRNDFTVIPASVQFRPESRTQRPRIAGTIIARIDAAGSGKYAELDGHGRYKVVLPFDLSGRKDGKASAWVRMAQPYAGSGHGMHFPLHKGTEVLLTFIDGDPDRPIIAGAVPNPETPSPVTADNQTMAAITSSGGNRIHMEDREESERILMHSPKQKSFIRIGAPNDPSVADDEGPHSWHFRTKDKDGHYEHTEGRSGIHLATNGLLDITAEASNKLILGEETETFIVGYAHNVIGARWDTVIGLDGELHMAVHKAFDSLKHDFHPETITVGGQVIKIKGSKIRFVGTATEVVGNKTGVTGNVGTVEGARTTVKGSATNVVGSDSEVLGKAENVTGEGAIVNGHATTVSGTLTSVQGNALRVSGGHTTVSGQGSHIMGGTVTVQGEGTAVSADVQEITSAHVNVSGVVDMII